MHVLTLIKLLVLTCIVLCIIMFNFSLKGTLWFTTYKGNASAHFVNKEAYDAMVISAFKAGSVKTGAGGGGGGTFSYGLPKYLRPSQYFRIKKCDSPGIRRKDIRPSAPFPQPAVHRSRNTYTGHSSKKMFFKKGKVKVLTFSLS